MIDWQLFAAERNESTIRHSLCVLLVAVSLSACDSSLVIELPPEDDLLDPADGTVGGTDPDSTGSEPDSEPAPEPAPESPPETSPEPVPDPAQDPGTEPDSDPSQEPVPDPAPGAGSVDPDSVFQPAPGDMADVASVYTQNGYADTDVIRIDLRTVTSSGTCTIEDLSGCTLADVIADTNANDEFKVDINVHFKTPEYPDDGLVSNAELRQRGGGTRQAPQKSFRVKLDDSDRLWRGERHLQLNKHPFESSRIRNKLSFDLMSEIPHLFSFRTQFANLWIDNGQGAVDYGLFTHVERGDRRYLERRGLSGEGKLYKAKLFRFRELELQSLLLDASGEPVDEFVFETVLEIEAGDDHRNLVNMINALHNPQRSFRSVFDQYFNENNVLTWLTVNLLFGQYDAVRHNYFLYNPNGSEKFYFLPWDYDTSFIEFVEPANDLNHESLLARLQYGYANGSSNFFISSYYRLPGAHQRILSAAEEIRQNYMTDQNIVEKANRYSTAIQTFAAQEPDSVHNPFFNAVPGEEFSATVRSNHDAIRNRFSYPLPPTLNAPTFSNGQWQFTWQPAHDLTGNSISYDLQIATSVDFQPDSIVVTINGIADQGGGLVSQSVDGSRLSSGNHYVRLIARASNEPQRYWQIADNRLDLNNRLYLGVIQFESP
ncbi:MAG: CotH kinase family protein [Granulosicoccus sp.]|nr:CotH kinase family protein [Granulosicoccus sp.]